MNSFTKDNETRNVLVFPKKKTIVSHKPREINSVSFQTERNLMVLLFQLFIDDNQKYIQKRQEKIIITIILRLIQQEAEDNFCVR